MRCSRLVVSVALALLVIAAVGSGAVLSTPAVAQAPSPSGLCDSEGISQFSDVGDSDYAAAYILCMRALGLSQGRSGGDYGPDRGLNRGQMASFLIRLWTDQLGQQCPTDVAVPFTDTAGTTHEANIECLFGLGITQGTSATTYGPQDPLKASQIARFLYRTYGKAGGDQCAGTATSELVRASECLFSLRVVPSTGEATSATPVIRSQMGVYVIGLWHNLTGKGLPPAPPQLATATPPTTTTTQPAVTQEPAMVDGAGLWVINADGTDLTQVASRTEWAWSWLWSPDGSRIAYERGGGVWVAGADGADAKQIVSDLTFAEGWSWSWSPDGSRIAYLRGPGEVWVVSADGANAKQIASAGELGHGNTAPVWSPDGSRIAHIRHLGDELWVVGADGANPKQIASASSSTDFHWSPDSSRILYVDRRSGLWVVGADGANPKQIASYGSVLSESYLGWSPDGSRILYSWDGLWVVGADGANPQQITTNGRARWSPDGSRLVYRHQGVNGLWVVGADGANPSEIISGRFGACCPVWSPDGSRIADTLFDSTTGMRGLWVVGADGADAKQIISEDTTEWVWSPDSSRIAYSTRGDDNRNELWVVDVDGANAKQIAAIASKFFVVWALSPDGTRIAFATRAF